MESTFGNAHTDMWFLFGMNSYVILLQKQTHTEMVSLRYGFL